MTELYTFTCEVCGKECHSKSNPDTWKQGKLCWDCRNKNKTATQTASPKPTTNSASPTPYRTNCESFDMAKYVDELLDVYEVLKIKSQERSLEIPDTNLCQWATSVMIQKDRR